MQTHTALTRVHRLRTLHSATFEAELEAQGLADKWMKYPGPFAGRAYGLKADTERHASLIFGRHGPPKLRVGGHFWPLAELVGASAAGWVNHICGLRDAKTSDADFIRALFSVLRP